MLSKEFFLELNLKNKNRYLTNITVNQGDTRSVIFNIRIFDENLEMDYSGVDEAVIFFSKPDKTVVQYSAIKAAQGFTYTCNQNVLAAPGAVTAGVALYGPDKERITTLYFIFWVEADLLNQTIKSSSEYDALGWVMAAKDALQLLFNEFPAPAFKVIDKFNNESDFLQMYPDGSGIEGGFAVGEEKDVRYFFWNEAKQSWNYIGPFVGPKGDPGTGTLFFFVTSAVTSSPNGSRLGDMVVNGGTEELEIGGQTLNIGDIAPIVGLSPLMLDPVDGNLRGPAGPIGPTVTVVDSLESDSENDALSAKQGKLLAEKQEELSEQMLGLPSSTWTDEYIEHNVPIDELRQFILDMPRYLNRNMRIIVGPGETNDEIEVYDFYGPAELEIAGGADVIGVNTHKILQMLISRNSLKLIYIHGFEATTTADTHGFFYEGQTGGPTTLLYYLSRRNGTKTSNKGLPKKSETKTNGHLERMFEQLQETA